MKLYISTLLFALGWLTPAFNAEPAKACLYNCEDSVVLALNKNKQQDTGAWIAFFDLGLEKGPGESFLGLQKVDYKIEAGHLFRYTAAYGKTWTKLTTIELYRLGPWQMVRIPKYQLLNPKAKIRWRVALFPKDHQHPLKLPAKGPAVLDPYKSIGLQAYVGHGLPLDLTLATSYQKQLELPAFVSGEIFDIPKTEKIYTRHELNSSLDQLIEPQQNSLFVGSVHLGPQPLSEEVAAAHRVANSAKHCVFDLPQLKTETQNQWLNQAKATSAFLADKSAYFVQNFNRPLPQLADGALYHWQGDLQSIYEHLKEQRQSFPGPLWYFYNPNQTQWGDSLKNASQKIWSEHQLMPMLLPNYSFEKCSHQLFSDVLWQKYCTLHLKSCPQKPISLKTLRSIKNMAPKTYLSKLLAQIQAMEVSN